MVHLLAGPALLALALPAPVERLLESGDWDATPSGFRIVALSHVADACVERAGSGPPSIEVLHCVVRARELAEQTAPEGLNLDAPDAEYGLWLSHWALVLADEQRIDATTDRRRLHAVAHALAKRTLAESTAVAPSWARHAERFPADQAVTLAALGRHDRLFGTRLLDEPLARYKKRYLRGERLPVSEATGAYGWSASSRGCALSWSVRYLAEVDRPLAALWWRSYRAGHFQRVGPLGGFREWAHGKEGAADADSGPIVMGIGAAATAFGLVAARALDDDDTWQSLERTAGLAEGLGLGGGVEQLVLAAAIRDLGQQPVDAWRQKH